MSISKVSESFVVLLLQKKGGHVYVRRSICVRERHAVGVVLIPCAILCLCCLWPPLRCPTTGSTAVTETVFKISVHPPGLLITQVLYVLIWIFRPFKSFHPFSTSCSRQKHLAQTRSCLTRVWRIHWGVGPLAHVCRDLP